MKEMRDDASINYCPMVSTITTETKEAVLSW